MHELTVLGILEVAEMTEREAAKFYRKAAGMYEDPTISKLFAELSHWEKRHVRVFAEMKDRLAEQTREGERFELDRGTVSQLQVPLTTLNEYSEPAKELTGREARADVIKMAIQKEQSTIGYYTSLTGFALGQDNTQAIKHIIDEERRHVRILKQSLQQAYG